MVSKQCFLNGLPLAFAIVITTLGSFIVLSQDLPSIACPNMFQYVSSGKNNTGKITIYGALVAAIKVEAQFSQQEPIRTSYSDRLTLLESLPITEANLQNGRKITYRVDFPDPKLLPKLIRLSVNDRIICWSNGLPAPSTIFTLHHIFYPSLKTLSRSTQSNRLINPFADGTNALNPSASTELSANTSANCGQEGFNLTSSIVIGNDFERGRFPWLTAIFLRNEDYLMFQCGGSLISTRTVITAALCFREQNTRVDQIVVYLGRHNFYASESGVEKRNIQALIKHPDFNVTALSDADIALLHMETPVIFTQFIRPICLWSSSAALSNNVAYLASWDSKNFLGSDFSPVPKVFEADIVSEVECLRSKSNFLYFTTPRTLCAGKRDGTGLCFGALGTGLMVNHEGNWILRAIFSLVTSGTVNGKVTCNLRDYIIYCDLSKHVTWVRRNMLQ